MSDYVIRCATICFTCTHTHTAPDEKNTSFMTKKEQLRVMPGRIRYKLSQKKRHFFLHRSINCLFIILIWQHHE